MTRAGVEVDLDNKLVQNALMTYVKANFGISNPDDKAKYLAAYQLYVSELSLSDGYKEVVVDEGLLQHLHIGVTDLESAEQNADLVFNLHVADVGEHLRVCFVIMLALDLVGHSQGSCQGVLNPIDSSGYHYVFLLNFYLRSHQPPQDLLRLTRPQAESG